MYLLDTRSHCYLVWLNCPAEVFHPLVSLGSGVAAEAFAPTQVGDLQHKGGDNEEKNTEDSGALGSSVFHLGVRDVP